MTPDELTAAVREALNRAIVDRITEQTLETAASDAALREALAPLCLASHERKILASIASGDATSSDLAGLTRSAFASYTRGLIFEAIRGELGRSLTTHEIAKLCGIKGGIEGDAIRFEINALAHTPVLCGALLREVVLEVIAADALSTFVADTRTLFRLAKAEAEGLDDRRSHTGAINATRLRDRLRAMASTLAAPLKALEEGK